MGGLLRVRGLAFCLCFMLFFSSIPVYADSVSEDTLSLAQYHFVQLGFIVKDWDWFTSNSDFLDYCMNLENGTYFYMDEDGLYHFTDEASEIAKSIIDTYIEEKSGGSLSNNDYGDYYILPTYSYDDVWSQINNETYSGYYDVSDRNALLEMMNKYDALILDSYSFSGTTIVYGYEFNDLYFIYQSKSSDGYGGNPVNVKCANDNADLISSGDTNYNISGKEIYHYNSSVEPVEKVKALGSCVFSVGGESPYALDTINRLITKNGERVQVWKNTNKLAAFLTGTGVKPSYYTTSSYANFDVDQDNSFSIDQDTYNNIKGNFNTVNQQFTQVIDDINIQNNSSITYNQLQQIIDNSVTNVVNNYYYITVNPEEPETEETEPSVGEQEIIDAMKGQTEQDQQFRDEDRQDATSAGEAMSGVASDLENVKNKWEILWYPIEFTNNLLAAFTGSGASTYAATFGNISGYTYNEESGLLEPVYSRTRSASSGSAVLTFPAFTLPGLDVQVWDSYEYDLGTLKNQFPTLFDALYVILSMVEVVMFVEFLKNKYNEVFRK